MSTEIKRIQLEEQLLPKVKEMVEIITDEISDVEDSELCKLLIARIGYFVQSNVIYRSEVSLAMDR